MLNFKILNKSGFARTGILKTKHGEVQTPTFMAVGTEASVKGLTPEMVKATGTQIVLGNTYHLMLRPGAQRVADFGGLHQFMNWHGPILTDSGGFQIMSLQKLTKITDEGAYFASHIDGSKHFLSPQKSVEIQHLLDSNITMALDICTKSTASKKELEKALIKSSNWAKLSKEAFCDRQGYGIFGIVQGGLHKDLRQKSLEDLNSLEFDGIALGGLAVGETQQEMIEVLNYMAPLLPENKPHYLMGVGKPSDLVAGVASGIDMFDCVLPTRCGRTGRVFTSHGVLNIHNAMHKDSKEPLDKKCLCPACQNYTRGYLHHLFNAGEILGAILLTQHNLWFYQNLMASMRQAINENKFSEFYQTFQETYKNDSRM